MVTVKNLHTVLFDYLSLSIDRKVFTLRFAALLSEIEKSGEPPAIELAHAMYSHLVLAIAGAIPEIELRKRLAAEATIIEISPEFEGDSKKPFVRKQETSSSYSPVDPVLV
jgi:hypothetical protein